MLQAFRRRLVYSVASMSLIAANYFIKISSMSAKVSKSNDVSMGSKLFVISEEQTGVCFLRIVDAVRGSFL